MRVAALLLALATPVAADEDAIVEAWSIWVAQNGVTRSNLAITKDGVLLSDHGIGRQADAPVPLASLSKAVTGACVLALVDEGKVSLDTPLSDVFGNRPDHLGNGGDITIGALLTHTSGLDFDRTQTVLNPTLWGAEDMHEQIAELALARPVGEPAFFYNNENYAVLGSVIMEVTGQTVQEACTTSVLGDRGSAGLDPQMGGSLAWGGWGMSVADFALFATEFKIEDSWPRHPLGGGVDYGPGVFLRDTASGTNMWHFGARCLMGLSDHGSFFFVLDNGWGVTEAYDICPNQDQGIELNNLLATAAYSGG